MEAVIIEDLVKETVFIISPHKLKIATDEALRVMINSGVFYPREIAENIAYAVLRIVHQNGGLNETL
jgi:hypothetical protein